MGDEGRSDPFVQGAFEALPELPRRPHVYWDAQDVELELADGAFGPMKVHVRRYGQGPPLLLVHGLMTSSYSWRYALSGLGQHFTCYAPDLPGAGRSDAPVHVPYTADRLGTWLGEVQGVLGLRGCPVIGNSMGGYLGMRWALQSPGAMSRLVNLHSPGLPEARLYALQVGLRLPGARAALDRVVRRDPERWAHRMVHYHDESLKSLEEAREYGAPLSTEAGREAFVRYLRDAMAPRPMAAFQRALERLLKVGEAFPVPLQLIYAESDPVVPPKIGDKLAKLIPGAEFVRLPQASHFAHVDSVDRFVATVLPFLTAG